MAKITNADIFSTYQEWVKVKKEIKDLEEREKLLKFTLVNSIPSGKTKAGVFHKVGSHTSIAWKDITAQVVAKLVPKTKQSDVAAIIAFNTNKSVTASFIEEGVEKEKKKK